jgi:hypothetical protein
MDNITSIARRRDLQLPIGQVNAHLGDQLLMRVGIPHTGGRLASHAFENGYSAMVCASAFWDGRAGEFKFPEYTPLMDTDWALDSAGFTAMLNWSKKGTQAGMAGVYPWTYSSYLSFANTCGASWYAVPDLCVEPAIAKSEEEVNFRIRATATLLEGCLRTLYAWQNELVKRVSTDTVMNMVRPPLPVLQGWSVDQYLRSLELTQAVWERWQPWLAPPALIGIGSVCRRDLNHPTHGLWAVLDGLEGRLPPGSKAHCFGVKGASLARLQSMPWIASADSMAWDFGARVKARNAKHSNTFAHRCAEMTRWMEASASKLRSPFNGRSTFPLAA